MESLENKVFVGYCRVSIKGQSESDWVKIDDLKNKGLSIPSIAKVLGVSKSALYNKANERYP